jgi:hypothetical protein
MKFSSLLIATVLTGFATGAPANDTMAQLGTGGLVFVTNLNIEMLSEDLSISRDVVKVVYQFRNKGDADEHILVAFPMPDITGSPDFMTSVPTDDPENLFGFQTTFNGEPVEANLHQYAFAVDIDQSATLRDRAIPLAPQLAATQEAIDKLSDADKQDLFQLGMVVPMEYDAGQGMQTDYVPAWTLKSTYSWEATFPAGQTVEVVHTYKPSVGGTVATTFVDDHEYAREQRAAYDKKYCMDESFINAVRKTQTREGDYLNTPFTESWSSYIWSTGANWSGQIGKFTLTVDKGDAGNLISFCGENVRKISPTKFQMTATDWWPPYGRELEILILDRQKPSQ